MCGIVGMVDASNSGFFQADKSTFFGMMLLNSFRGIHSTGAFGVSTKSNNADVLKVLKDPYHWSMWDVSEKFLERMVLDYWAVVGHGRSATQGKISVGNAHPFIHPPITMVHNGTLNNLEELNRKFKKNFEVDSEMITFLISSIGIDETIKCIRGAYCLVWTDSTDGSLSMIRNYDRPLEIGEYHNVDKIAFASERHVLKWAAEKSATIKSYQSLPANELWTFTRENASLKKTKRPLAQQITHYYGTTKVVKSGTPYPIDDKLYIGNKQQIVGDRVRFTVLDVVENKRPDDTYYISIKGLAIADKRVQVVAQMEGTEEDFLSKFPNIEDEMLLIGSITSYIELMANQQLDYRVFVGNISVYPEIKGELLTKVANILLPPPKKEKTTVTDSNVITLTHPEKEKPKNTQEVVKLLDDSWLSKKRFMNHAQMGCTICHSHPTVEEASQTLVTFNKEASGWELYCPACVQKHGYDLNNLKLKAVH